TQHYALSLHDALPIYLCRLCPWLNAPPLVPAFELKLIWAPKSATSSTAQNFSHPLRPAGIKREKGVKVRGKLLDKIDLSWQFARSEEHTSELQSRGHL